ncbi:hypothetical protein PM082_002272 [Marasmius tenuissimus]|nr:hypothetical protein PM082_002272 [Marasmius tenuissimus]
MTQSNHSVFKGSTALFDETLYSKYPDAKTRGFTPASSEPFTLGENPNIPLEDEDSDDDQDNALLPDLRRCSEPSKRSEPQVDKPAGGPAPGDVPLPQSGPLMPPGEPTVPLPAPAADGPCRSLRQQKGTTQPGNIFGEQWNPNKPSDIVHNFENKKTWRKVTGDKEPSHPVDQTSSSRSRKGKGGKKGIPGPLLPLPAPEPSGSTESHEEESVVKRLTQEGGVGFVIYLLNNAVPVHDLLPTSDTPDFSNIREWTLHNILKPSTLRRYTMSFVLARKTITNPGPQPPAVHDGQEYADEYHIAINGGWYWAEISNIL